MAISFAEENYLKIIYRLSESTTEDISTNAIAELTQNKAASVTDMLRKMSDKGWVNYQKYQGVRLSEVGEKIALDIVRKHRLWVVFLVKKMGFNWDEVHEIAEQLEHALIQLVQLGPLLQLLFNNFNFVISGLISKLNIKWCVVIAVGLGRKLSNNVQTCIDF